MKKNKKNVEPNYKIKLGNRVFYSDHPNYFIIDLDKLPNSLITRLPINTSIEPIVFEFTTEGHYPRSPEMILTRKNSNLTEIDIIYEMDRDYWYSWIALDSYVELEIDLIKSLEKSYNLKFISHDEVNGTHKINFKIIVTSKKVRDAFNESARIYYLITKKLDYVEDSGFSFLRQALLSGFQLDASKISSSNKQNNNNSGV